MNDGRYGDDRRDEHEAQGVRGTRDTRAAGEARGDARDTGAALRDLAGGAGHGGPGRRGPGTGGGPGGPGGHEPHEPDGDDAHEDRGARDGGTGLEADELALSRLLKEAVQDVTPRPDSLDHLRHAVPARRTRKRQALVGLAAASVLLVVAVPALVHVSNGGSGSDRTSVAGHGEEAHGGTAGSKGTDGGWQVPGQSSGGAASAGQSGQHGTGEGSQRGGDTSGADPEGTLAATAPACVASALGNAQASVGTPDAEGRVYGTFRVTNVSASECTVDGAGTVDTAAQGTADPAKIMVVDHTEGDQASRLPSPAQQPSELILKPGTAYEVQFAWVPSESCQAGGSGGGDGGSTPGPSPSDGTGTVSQTAGADQAGLTAQLARTEGEPVDGTGSVAVSHTAEPGAPTASTTISNACAGTLYRTGLLASE